MPERYDESIEGVDENNGSIKYDWKYLGYLYMGYVENKWPTNINDKICGAIQMYGHVQELTEDGLMGKVRPSIQVSDDYYDYVDE